ncbi:MAG TPA: hypothetical protein VFY36_02175 [Solirubrobacteraceae bacterium]|nr:hypothetical protein [Solirubrobacteraceae bacterium]
MPIGDPRVPVEPTSPAAREVSNLSAFVAELAASERSLTIEDARGGPPPEVLEQMGVAGEVGERMREAGQEVRFSLSVAGRVEVELREGEEVTPLSSAEAFDLAAGKPLG